jgi:hypothetical protein
VSEGSVFQRSDGRWVAKYKDAQGKWRYLYRKSKTEAKQALRLGSQGPRGGVKPQHSHRGRVPGQLAGGYAGSR